MKQELKEKLLLLADKYEVEEFIMDDPIQFPHRYTDKADIEISGLIASWIATGNRKAIIKSGDRIDQKIFYRRLGAYYGKLEQWIFEPKVADSLFNDYIKRADVKVLYKYRITDVQLANGYIKKYHP